MTLTRAFGRRAVDRRVALDHSLGRLDAVPRRVVRVVAHDADVGHQRPLLQGVADGVHVALPAPRLEALDLGENLLKELGAEYLATAPCLRDLKALSLDRCEIPLAGARLLMKKAKFLDGLRRLDVGHNHFGPVGLAALLERRPAALHTLRMHDNDLFDNGAALMAGSPASDALLEVDLSQNGLGAAAALALGESAHLRGLLVQRLTDNRINDSAASPLAASPLGRRLAVLELKDPPPVGGDATPF
jgi:Ran GTPase-activating protein (RanGAP) involved in mRNA processing and transport